MNILKIILKPIYFIFRLHGGFHFLLLMVVALPVMKMLSTHEARNDNDVNVVLMKSHLDSSCSIEFIPGEEIDAYALKYPDYTFLIPSVCEKKIIEQLKKKMPHYEFSVNVKNLGPGVQSIELRGYDDEREAISWYDAYDKKIVAKSWRYFSEPVMTIPLFLFFISFFLIRRIVLFAFHKTLFPPESITSIKNTMTGGPFNQERKKKIKKLIPFGRSEGINEELIIFKNKDSFGRR